jgi:hypothetical protein
MAPMLHHHKRSAWSGITIPYKYLTILACIILVMATIGMISQAKQPGQEVLFIIPAGNARREAAGQTALMLPKTITLTLGERDTLRVRNEDGFVARIGGIKLNPGQQYTQRFMRAGTYDMMCATLFHQDQIQIIVVDRRTIFQQLIDRWWNV